MNFRAPFLHFFAALALAINFCACQNKGAVNRHILNHPKLVDEILQDADSLSREDKADQAAGLLEKKFSQIDDAGPGDLLKRLIWLRGYHQGGGRYTKALAYTDSIAAVLAPLAKQKQYSLLYAENFLNRGDALFRLSHFNEAYIAYYTAKLKLGSEREVCSHPKQLFNFQARLGNISYDQNRFLDAASWHKRSIAALTECGQAALYPLEIQGALDNIGLSYMHAGKLDSSIAAYRQALTVIANANLKTPRKKKELEIAKAVVVGNLGTIYYKKGLTDSAVIKYKENIAVNSQPGYGNDDAFITRMKLAELYLAGNRLNEAAVIMAQVKTPPKVRFDPQDKLQWLFLQATYAKAQGRLAAANSFLQEYIDVMVEFRKSQAVLMNSNYGKEFQLLSQNFDVQNLKRKDQLKTAYLAGAFIICLLAGGIIYLTLKNNKRIEKIAIDIAQHNQQLEVTLKALEKSSIENSSLLNIVAHDLKNPIGAVYGLTTLMLEETGRSPDDLEMLGLIRVSAENMTGTINDLLAAKINNVSDSDKRAIINLTELLGESVALLRYRAREKQQKIKFTENDEILVIINKDQIWRVANNLIVNAIKFSHQGGAIKVWCEVMEALVTVCVEDHGIGIPQDLHDKLFELTLEAKRKGTSGEDSYGLGLYTSRNIITSHGGKMWFESVAGQFTRFCFSLPVVSK